MREWRPGKFAFRLSLAFVSYTISCSSAIVDLLLANLDLHKDKKVGTKYMQKKRNINKYANVSQPQQSKSRTQKNRRGEKYQQLFGFISN